MTPELPDPAALIQIVSIQLGRRNVAPDDRLIEDLGAESADLVNLAATIDDRFGIYLEEESLAEVKTVSDLQKLVQQEGERAAAAAEE